MEKVKLSKNKKSLSILDIIESTQKFLEFLLLN